jgi:hypothetical protein
LGHGNLSLPRGHLFPQKDTTRPVRKIPQRIC